MKTKCHSLKLTLRLIAILPCSLAACGCSPRKPVAPIPNEPKVESAATMGEIVTPNSTANDGTPNDSIETPATAAAAVEPPAAIAAPTSPAEPPQTWSVQRIIALSATGPIVIDVSANIGGKSLDEAAEAATGRAIAQIAKDLEKPWTWAKLLDHPLIGSGWLGNLVSEGEQRKQLISMYNKDGDDEVDDEELPAFLTRGLARGTAFRFTDIGTAPNAAPSRSPWEQLDANQDSTLDKAEIANIANVAARFDLNADRVITIAEMQANRATMSTPMMGSSSMLDTKSAMALSTDQKPQQIARKLLEHYTFLRSLSREQWPGWSDTQWDEFDTDRDQQITSKELERITTVQPELDLRIQFHGNAEASSALSATLDAKSGFSWVSRLNTAGQASGKLGALAVFVTDSYTAANQSGLRAQLAAALSNPQVAMVFRSQLQLSEGAFDVLDADNDDKLSDEEFDNAWNWLTAIRGSRILARWMYAESAWFRMADADADGRVTAIEMQNFASFLTGLDRDNDGLLSPIEMPLTVRLEIARSDERLANNFPPQTEMATVELGWFAASDSNNDGFISDSEFLGSKEDFLAYDANNDGFISPPESYKNPIPRVQ